MVDSTTVLSGQTMAYTCYAIAIMLIMAWFAYTVSRKGRSSKISTPLFYSFTGLLILLGVSLHIITYNTIPWAAMDINRADIKADKVFNISVENHTFKLPSEKLIINLNDKVLFNVESKDLTYGFGLFRTDQSMLFQMQVVPGHNNDILWQFDKAGVYTIRSTEYSGPKGIDMVLKDVVEVIGTN